MSVLDDDAIRGLLLQAWQESQPGTVDAHEEGGFVLRDANGSLSVERWICATLITKVNTSSRPNGSTASGRTAWWKRSGKRRRH